ncbi:SpoIIE family protein phosphatase [Halodesulfovibrio marinisediminis]|uniref:Sigma-B regulation protein RsbU (Phosphoserine phosphatase) n=1 Tax=Halodesulfovibrio marinisediminis DSM 17456 TaxID=1121457 RepID=A0A1N6HA76_9BACT|nr:SpoIIE family protein phosphatase [Halodesulfovibrio marinisediminis]SIO16721.1 sigma-B regulation protein RsbU (phosphoserine phosphatase) [Halodesulfovibrio marinisediminis DSM 17456]
MELKRLTFIHRLSLRWKLFLTLVLFSVLPICGAVLTVQELQTDIKEYLYESTRNDLVEQASRSIENIAVNSAKNLENSEQMRGIILDVVAFAAQHFLDMLPPVDVKPLYSDEIKPDLPYPEDLVVDPLHAPTRQYMVKYGSDISKYISLGNIAFFLPQNQSERAAAKLEAKKLIRLLPLFKELKKSYGSFIYNLYIGTKSGLLAYYPAHAGMPEGYDPRDRLWYRLAMAEKKIVWRAPLRDISTGRLLFTVSAPLYNMKKEIIGVVGLDILMEQGLSSGSITAAWSNQTRLILAEEADDKVTGSAGLRIIASAQRKSKEDNEYSWIMGTSKKHWVVFEDNEVKAKFMNAIASGTSGTLLMPWGGEDCLVAWAPFKGNNYFITVVPEEDVMHLTNKVLAYLHWASSAQQRVVEIAVVVVIFLTFLFAVYASRAISKPMNMMVASFKELAQGNFSARVDLKTGDERDILVETFNRIGPQLEHLVETQQALDVAHEIQENLLPARDPRFPGWQISGAIRYCDQTGGDYYDYYMTNCDNQSILSIVVGDVSGHGVASALLMTTARALLRVHTECARISASRRVSQVNNLLTQDVHGTGRFMTLFYLEMIGHSDLLRWVRAGHDPAIVYLPEQDEFTELKGKGLPLGVMGGVNYEESEIELTQQGAIILLGTDGIWEARKGGYGDLYGKEQLRELIREHASKTAEEIRDCILEAVEKWQKNVPNVDDVTLVVLKKDKNANKDCENVSICNLDFFMEEKNNNE